MINEYKKKIGMKEIDMFMGIYKDMPEQTEEAMSGGCYGCYHDYAAWREFGAEAGFTEIKHYFRPDGLPRQRQPWLATLWRKAQYQRKYN